jgi:hypothetical protein
MKMISKINIGLTIFMFSFLFSLTANAATIELNLEKAIVSASSSPDIAVLVTINSEGQDINTAQSVITFPANLLEATKIDISDSVFTFWLEQPSFDNAKGEIRFVGGSTSGFTGPGLRVMRVEFKVKGSGTGRLSITDGAITASDGTGSNVYNTAKGLDINIPTTAEFQAVKIERAAQEATLAKQLPAQMGLSIPFYPDQTKWNNHAASFKATWNISPDTLQAGLALDKNPNTIPDASADALVGSKIFPALADGVWYLHLRYKNNIGWGSTLHYRIALDTTPPSAFKIISDSGFQTNNPKPVISYASSDLVSGINNYIIRLDGAVATTTNKTSYTFSPLLPGTHQLVVVAVDKAGNSTSETVKLEILPITSPTISYVNRNIIVDEGSIVAGGTALPKVNVLVQVQNDQKQIVAKQTAISDENGNWNIVINQTLGVGNYQLLVTAQDKNMASSFPAISDVIKVKQRPVLALGGLEINQTWFFVDLIIILIGAFFAGWFAYRKWREKLGKRVIIAQRDVINIFDNLDKDINELLKNYTEGTLDKGHVFQMKSTLKNMKENLEKSRRYVVDNIREIEK